MNTYMLDGAEMTSRETAYAAIARVMRFPSWFGNNLDALADCLGELRRDSVVIFEHAALLSAQLGDYGGKLLACFRDCAREVGFQFIERE